MCLSWKVILTEGKSFDKLLVARYCNSDIFRPSQIFWVDWYMQLSLSFLDRAFQEAENIFPCKVIYEWGSGALSGADWCEISGICGAAAQLVGICTNFHFHFLLSISKQSLGPRPASWSILAATCASNYEHFSPAQLSRGFSLHFCSQFQTDTSPLPGKHLQLLALCPL